MKKSPINIGRIPEFKSSMSGTFSTDIIILTATNLKRDSFRPDERLRAKGEA